MALSTERYQAVDAELQCVKQFLNALAEELQTSAPVAERRGPIWAAALEAEHAIRHLQHLLKVEHIQKRRAEEIRQRLIKRNTSQENC